jgi:hypothetical protein
MEGREMRFYARYTDQKGKTAHQADTKDRFLFAQEFRLPNGTTLKKILKKRPFPEKKRPILFSD